MTEKESLASLTWTEDPPSPGPKSLASPKNPASKIKIPRDGSAHALRCLGCAETATWTVLWINVAMTLLKLVFAVTTRSRSLMADALESAVDLLISGMVLAGLRISAKGQDSQHPYGYGKVELLISAGINIFLLTGALVFIGASLWEMITIGPEKPPGISAAVVAAASIIGNYIAYKYSLCAGQKLKSPAVLANAWVNWADAVTSAAVVIAVIAANLGWGKLDYFVGILIGLWIAKTALDQLSDSVRQLMDFSPVLHTRQIKELVKLIPGVREIRDLKTRMVGRKLWVDMEIEVSKDCSMSEGLFLIKKLKLSVIREIPDVTEVSVRLHAMP